MPDRVLVPTDDSPLAERAPRYAVETLPDATITTMDVTDQIDAVLVSSNGLRLLGYRAE